MANILLIVFFMLKFASTLFACINIWEAKSTDTNLCAVQTVSGEQCIIPFTYNNFTYYSCIINGPKNPSYLPQCITTKNLWSVCQVPTNAVINYVTTRQAGSSSDNSGSINGGTLIWIYGYRFAENDFSITPKSSKTNRVLLESNTASYECEINSEQIKSSRISCRTPSSIVEGIYFVRVFVNGYLIPSYQYISESQALIKITEASTPKINSIQPIKGGPESFLRINGDFKTNCYKNDDCEDDNNSRLTRVYIGAQLCDLMNENNNELHDDFTSSYLKCKMKGTSVDNYNISIIVSESYGRSVMNSSFYFVTPNEKIYNFQSYAELLTINPNFGSTEGSTTLTIIGKYLYHSDNVPAQINIAGSKCNVVKFDNINPLVSKIYCEIELPKYNKTEYHGNRGINLIKDTFSTSFALLDSVTPSNNAKTSYLDSASFQDSSTIDETVWMTGFLAPEKSSNYLFSLKTNGVAKLFLSTDDTSLNKKLIASYDPSTSSSYTSTVTLESGKLYYLQAIASKSKGGLNIDINTKMYDTCLNGKISSMVKTEIQDIEISSTIIPETTVVSYNGLQANNGSAEIQTITVLSQNQTDFILNFDGANTNKIPYRSSALVVQKELNDLPTLVSEGVTVSNQFNSDGGVTYIIIFTPNRGDVPEITETSGNVLFKNNETAKGIPSQNKFQININDAWSNLFDIKNDTTSFILSSIEEVFKIRCPLSIQTKIPTTTFAIFDYESECTYVEKELSKTAFCGKCARKNSNLLFTNLNSPMSYNQLCFAYKIVSPIQYIVANIFIDGDKKKNAYINVNTIADSQWHYICVDLYQGILKSWSTTASFYPAYRLTLNEVSIYPVVPDMFIDVVSIRNIVPSNIDDSSLLTRRIFPKLQMVYNSLKITRNETENSLIMSFRPNNCTTNLNQSLIRQSINNIPSTKTTTKGSGPVDGVFDLKWNSTILTGISSQATDLQIRNLLQSVEGIGTVKVTRSKDCAGFKWRIEWTEGGKKIPLKIASSALIGNNPTISTNTIVEGGVEFYPIQDEMLRTIHSSPQVSVKINGIPSKCSTNCNFETSIASTPIVHSIDTSNPKLIKITGSGFDSNVLDNNKVYIGKTECKVNSATSTNIFCIPDDGPVGNFNFNVKILPYGTAKMYSTSTYKFSLNASDISKGSFGTGGGVLIDVKGSGFSEDTKIKIDGNDCPIKEYSKSSLTCIVPPNPTQTNKSVDVDIVDGVYNTTIKQKLIYDYTNTPIVTNVSQTTNLNVLGDDIITIDGRNFNTDIGEVFFDNEPVNVLSYNSSKILIKTPSLKPGLYNLIIPSGLIGNALCNIKLEYKFHISSFTPNEGSHYGGSVITVYGDGFHSKNCNLNKVIFEEGECKILDCSDKWIRCKTPNTKKIHEVDNNGNDPYYGRGYSWSIPYLKIYEGEYVNWKWSAPGTVKNINYMVQQVSDPTSYNASGFNSGSPSSSGSFIHQFNTIGTYHYWSGFVDSSNIIYLRGVVDVMPDQDRELSIDVTLNGLKAQKCVFPFIYNSINYTSCTNVDFGYSWCSPNYIFNGQIIRCAPLAQPPTDNCVGSNINLASCSTSSSKSPYNFKFTSCNLATVSLIFPLNGSAGDKLTVLGNGFGANNCENKILIGDYECRVVSSSNSQIICEIDDNSGLKPGLKYNLDVQIKNIGSAIQNQLYVFEFLPKITSITPNIGSSEGDTEVEINGDGFTDKTTIQLGGKFYNNSNSNITYNRISLVTKSFSNGIESPILNIDGFKPVIKMSKNFTYEYSSQVAPTITSIFPLEITSSTSLNIYGSGFGNDPAKLNVKVGSQTCVVTTANNNSIVCSLAGLKVGSHDIVINLKGVGNSIKKFSNLTIKSLQKINSIYPSCGSLYGGTKVKISGNGFDSIENTQVKIGNKSCNIISVTPTEILFQTVENAIGTLPISINSGGFSFPSSSFSYNVSLSPTVSSVFPLIGTEGQLITIDGFGFGISSSNVNVEIGTSNCAIQSVTNNQIKCRAGLNNAGSYPVLVLIDQIGYGTKNQLFNYSLIVSSISNVEGSYGGGLEIILTGSGFNGFNTLITICNNPCVISGFNSSTQISCIVPSKVYVNIDTVCPLVVTVNGVSTSQTFTYKKNLTPLLSNLYPLRGGTGGGTLITLNGSNLPNDKTKIKITIADSECKVANLSSNFITCNTGSFSKSSKKMPILLFVSNVGFAINTYPIEFHYIDLWSSKFTWGGVNVPQKGELVIIGPNQTVYFDTTTPVLKGVIIQGGSLIFDDNQDVNLNAEYIIISDNGTLQIGTETNPFQHFANITMYGSSRSIELPIFGSKVIGLRNGILDMHGKSVGRTWTYLAYTASNQSTQIQLTDSVSWSIGAKIVIATTGDKFSQKESEVRRIVALSNDGKTLTLDSPLNYEHLSVKRSNAGVDVYIRAEVGLLSRNVIFNSVNDDSWDELRSADACPTGFDPGEFATMTCYLGRYGNEIGSDQFGATIMINGENPNQFGNESVIARISNVELYHVGQAFRFDRYAIHFHSTGDSPSSYIKECAIYESFNRAINLHSTNYITVERNVIYNIMGSAIYLQDGVEIGNIFQYNLIIFVKTSSSLVNDDITPAAFFINNPNNTLNNNAVAGNSHFGYWFRFLDHPDGISFTINYCPNKIPFGKFFNNSVHSVGRFGLWIYPTYTPTYSGSCNDINPSKAVFELFISYKNDKGAEWVMSNNIQFKNFIVYDQFTTGIETKSIASHKNANTYYSSYFYNDTIGPLVSDSIIIGNSMPLAQSSISSKGLVIPWDRGLLIKNIKFINFPDSNSYAIAATQIIGVCVFGCGGWTTYFTGLIFSNIKYKTLHRWSYDSIMLDLDGSLTGLKGNVVVSATNITDGDSRCRKENSYYQGTVCSLTNDWIRFSFNNAKPDLPLSIDITNTNNNTDVIPRLQWRLTHPNGYMVSLEVNKTYEIGFEQAAYPSNISYSGIFYGLKPNQFFIIKHKMNKKPDQVSMFGYLGTESLNPLSINSNNNGDWYWENFTRTLSYIIHNKQGKLPFYDVVVNFDAKKCRFANCELPSQPALRSPSLSRPVNSEIVLYWSNETTWSIAVIIRSQQSSSAIPIDYDSIIIPDGVWVIIDVKLPKLTRLKIEGVLEFDDTINNKLTVNEIFINGGQLIIGWENKYFTHNVEIELIGTRSSTEFILPNGFNSMGTKAIGVYGGLDLHGLPRYPPWTRLAYSAFAGSNQLTFVEPVDWQIGEEIVLSTTSYSAFQTEVFQIISISSNNYTVFLNNSLIFDHIVASESFPNNKIYNISAGVGLLSRNIKITGAEYAEQFSELFGSRIIVSDYTDYVYPDGSTIPVSVYYKGYARVSDIEFKHFGQFSRYSEDDFRYGILFSNLGNYDQNRPSYIKDCAFHNGFSGAIGILNSAGIPILNNVIHHSLDFSIRVMGNSNVLRNNLIVLNIWSSTFLINDAPFDVQYWGAIDISAADSAVVEDNLIAGTQRIGINFRGSPCPGDTLGQNFNHSIKRNHIYGAITGASVFPSNSFPLNCLLISEFLIYKSISAALYYQSASNVIIDSNILIDNNLSIFPQVYGPTSVSHIFEPQRWIMITDNLLVGTSPSFDCIKDNQPNDINSKYSILSKVYSAANNGKIGIVWANFMDGANGAPFKNWFSTTSYNYINGLMTLNNNTFAHYNTSCFSSRDAIITSSKNNDDGQMPVLIKNSYLYYVSNESKIFLHRPNLEKINPSDCVDMDCDGMKKLLLTSADSTFLGRPGHIISQSEFGWGDQSRGLGNYRIPQDALADEKGHLKNITSVFSYLGIVRDKNLCAYIDAWQAYECYGLDYRMLIIESLDSDTETRRLSPIAILSDNKYLDLINGPQDHQWCFGYTCQKRISTFLSIITVNKHYDVFMTGTPPKKLRFRIIQANSSYRITLSMTYFTSNNINVYKNINLVDPKNADRSQGYLVLKDPQNNPNQFLPTINDQTGSNYFNRIEKKIYFTIDGSDYIDLIMSQDLFLSFGIKATSIDDFFKSTYLVSNIAKLLNVPGNMIRRVDIVSENGNSLRVARQINNNISNIIQLNILLYSDPIVLSTDSVQYQNNLNIMINITADIVRKFYFGDLISLAASMNLTIKSFSLQVDGSYTYLQEIGSMKIIQDISNCRAQSPCEIQPILKLFDKNDQPLQVVQFGTILCLNVTLLTNSTQLLNQYQTCFDKNGSAVFSNIGFYNEANDVKIKYSLQNLAISFDKISSSFNIYQPNYSVAQTETELIVTREAFFNLSFYLVDAISKNEAPYPSYKNQIFTACIELKQMPFWNPSNAQLTTSNNCVKLDTQKNRFFFKNSSINTNGMYALQIKVYSNDYMYYITGLSNTLRVVSPGKSDNSNYYYNLQLKFDGKFIDSDKAKYITMIYNYFLVKHGVELNGPIFCFSGSINFVSGIVGFNSTLQFVISQSLINEKQNILDGFPLIWFSIGNFEANISKTYTSTANLINVAMNTAGVIIGTIFGVLLLSLIIISTVIVYRHNKKRFISKEENRKSLKNDQRQRYLDENIHDNFQIESVTVYRPNSGILMTRENDHRIPMEQFLSHEFTTTSISTVCVND